MGQFRAIVAKDAHLRDKSPESRIDDYKKEVFNKFNQLYMVAEKLEVDALFFPGDLFHFKAPTKTSHELVQEMMDFLKKFTSLPKQPKVIIVLGNHDLQYDQFEKFNKQPIGVLVNSGLVHLLDNNPYVFTDGDLKVRVVGTSWDREKNYINIMNHKREDEGYMICLSHALITPEGGNYHGLPCASYLDCFRMEADALVLGHMHADYGVKKLGNKNFISVGALSRGSLSGESIDRTITTALIEVSEQNGIITPSFKIIKLKTEPASEIFDLASYAARKEEDILMNSFIEELKNQTYVVSKDNILGSITDLAGFDQQVKDSALHYITMASSEGV